MAKYRYDIRRMKARPMTGFWSTLTPDQKAAALAYRGNDNLMPPKEQGTPAFLALLTALREASHGCWVPAREGLGE